MIRITLKNLFFHIRQIRKIQFLFLLIITIIASIIEMLSIVSVIPFVQAATNDNYLEQKSLILKFISISNKEDAIIKTGLFFAFLILINSLLRCSLIYLSAKNFSNHSLSDYPNLFNHFAKNTRLFLVSFFISNLQHH
jgi:hypothetical protein